ncbi:MAG: outer membrane receptor for ferrienterochelin and colicins [Dokdonia sp.]|jgi:outer membrane receptor for ferrienterochelin and colicins
MKTNTVLRNSLLLFVMVFYVNFVFSQEQKTVRDSTKVEALEEVVLTGQYNPQSVKKSVFEVTVINRKQIELQAGNNLADVLNQTLNLNIIPNASTGRSTVQLFGLNGEYLKILIDNIPLINEQELGSNADLTQINLDDVQRIEIVEGSMGVQYGANAVSGIINIITKKSSKYKWEVSPYFQEETIGNEYALLDEGRRIQSIRIGHTFSDNWNANASYTRNDFNGFLNNSLGPDHEFNDGLRGYEWLPKEQNTAKALVNYTNNENFKAFYKFEYFDEHIDRFSQSVNENFNASTQTTNPVGEDAIFNSTRMFHHLNFNGKLENIFNYDVSFSYQKQERDVEFFNTRIQTGERFNIENFEFESRDVIYSRGAFSNFLKFEKINLQVGYEVNQVNGFASSSSGTFDGNNIERDLGSYDIFGSAEFDVSKKLSIRPGSRLLTSSLFSPQIAASLSAKYIFDNDIEMRLLVGTSPKLPTYQELFTFFVDANHDVRGNENLVPEQGKSIFLHLKKKFVFGEKEKNIKFKSKLTFNYLDVSDRIELSLINAQPPQFRYINIDAFKTIGSFLNNTFSYKDFNASFGIGYSGQSKVLDSRTLENDDYLFALNINLNATYSIKPWGLVLSTFFKHNGPAQQFVQQIDENNQTILVRGRQDAFSFLDASLRKNFINNSLLLTLGARNLLDVTQVNTTSIEGGAHSGPPGNILLGYGRSYFLKLAYNLKFN